MLKNAILKSAQFDSPLGPILAIANDEALYLLEFVDARGVAREVENLRLKTKADIVSGNTDALSSIKKELKAYFSGDLKIFKTPVQILGTSFQQLVWSALMRISYGETRSYAAQAIAIKKPTAFRAVANANGANQLAIIVPCHRIINTSGALGGYGGGIQRKKWLLDHEKDGAR